MLAPRPYAAILGSLLGGVTPLLPCQPARAAEAGNPHAAVPSAANTAPGPEHDQLARLVGNWNVEIISYQQDPESPSSSQGKARFRKILGGRFIRQRLEGTLGQQDYVGIGSLGFDRNKQKYVGTWIDNLSTSLLVAEGHYEVESHTLVETGTSSTAHGDVPFKMTTQFVSSDHFVFHMVRVNPGQDDKLLLKLTYTRASAGDESPGQED